MRRPLAALAALVATGACFASAARAADSVYWANENNNTISFAKLDGSGGGGQLDITGATPNFPQGLALDPAAGKVYWANRNNTISFANLDGSGGGGQLPLTGATPDNPEGMALDPVAGKVYWANENNNTISFAKLDGSGGGGQLNTTGATPNFPVGVAVDPAVGTIYWANENGNTISFAKLDGSGGGGELNITGATPFNPEGVAIDSAGGKLYWANAGNNTISFAKLDGSGGGGQLPITGATASHPVFGSLLESPSGAGAPTITGGSVVGSLLSCSQGTWAADVLEAFLYRAPQGFAYQWSVDGVDIAGATASTYTANADGSYTCRVTASNQAGSTSQTSASYTVGVSAGPTPLLPLPITALRATISALSQTHPVFRVGPRTTPLLGRTTRTFPRGDTFSFRLNHPAVVTVRIQRKLPGRRVGRVCKPPSRLLRFRPRCTRLVTKAVLRRTARVGLNRIAFSGRIRGRALPAGYYRAAFTAANSAGTSAPRALNFRIVRG